MRIVQTVFGVFHHFDLARQLEARGHLTTIFSTWPRPRLAREGIPPRKVQTFPWIHTPEYLLRRHHLLPRRLDDQLGYANALAFDEYTLLRLPPCDALIALSGSSLKTGQLLQSRGGIFICDRGSSHQRFQQDLLAEEYRRWGLHQPPGDPRDTLREEEIYEQADAIVVPSTFAARSFVQMGVDPAKLHTIPFGVRLDTFTPITQPPDDRFEVLFVGGVSLRKGFPYLLQAFRQFKHPAKRLRVAGALAPEMTRILSSLPLDDVDLLGPVPQARLPGLMASSHVLILPSIEDGFGLVIPQALACGCPVIASENTGAPDMITHGVEGFIVPIRDGPAITAHLDQIAGTPGLHAAMRAAALTRVRHLGGWETYGDQWERLLLQAVGSIP